MSFKDFEFLQKNIKSGIKSATVLMKNFYKLK